jgi:calpain-5
MTFRKLVVTVIEARDLPPLDHGSVDPYVVVSVGSHFKAETHEIRRSVHPVWNAKLTLGPLNIHHSSRKATRPFNEICFEVRDWNRFIDRSVGTVYLAIDPSWRAGDVHEHTLTLEGKKGKVGTLRVSVAVRKVYSEKCAKKLVKEALKHRKDTGGGWRDPEFPHVVGAGGVAAWKPIGELSKQPRLFDEHAAANDVIQGALGDCYLLGAMSIVATRPELIRPLFKHSSVEDGIYVVSLFVEGKWQYVVLDEYLPVGAGGSLCYGSCRDPDSFWVPLLEKAQAKLFGSYSALDGGQTAEALLDLTGEGAETIEVDPIQFGRLMETGQLEKILKHWKKSRFLMGASIYREGAASEAKLDNGLLAGHAYSVLDVKNPVTEKGFLGLIGNKRQVLLKVRNPWGEQEWTGAWSDGAPEWTAAIRKQLKHEVKNDGIFWMDMVDFFANFNRLSVVRMYSHRLSIFDHKWHTLKFVAEWDEFSAGGCMNNGDAWTRNPQWALDVLDKEGSTVFVYVSQPDRRLHGRQSYDVSIGCYVLRVADNTVRLTDRGKILKQELMTHGKEDAKNATFGSLLHETDPGVPVFVNKRDVGLRLELAAGSYIVMPCTYEPNKTMQFSLGVFAERRCKVSELRDEKTHGIVVELPTEGGPPEDGPLARAEKAHDDKGVPFLQNPKLVLDFKKRRVSETLHLLLRVEPEHADTAVGVRIYKETKHHERAPLHGKHVLEELEANGKSSHELELSRDEGPYVFAPYAKTAGTTGKVRVSVTTKERVTLSMYY